MSLRSFDAIVAGLGAMGSATACHLALRGRRVLGLDRWAPGHTLGSSHGESRIIRELYYEHPVYVPLVQRAYELWRELGARTGQRLLHETGGLMIGPADGALVSGARRSAETFRLPYEMLSPAELGRRFPAFMLRDGYVAMLDPRAGYLTPEACVAAYLDLARESGATLRFEEPLVTWTPEGDGVRVVTSHGTYVADRLVISAGAYGRALLPDVDLPLAVERQVLFWFEPAAAERYEAPAFPIYMHENEHGRLCYGFPRMPRGVKAAVMHEGEMVADPAEVNRSVREGEVEPLRRALAGVLPELAAAPVRESAVCLFTNTPDHYFVIDHHPRHPQVLISSPARDTASSSRARSASSRPTFSPRGTAGST
jgi:sarcosine oxidase